MNLNFHQHPARPIFSRGGPRGSRKASQLLEILWTMTLFGPRRLAFAGILLGWNWFACFSWAGGSGLNTLVVINQNSTNSIELGNYYAERRQVPPENVLRINWAGANNLWDVTQFQTNLLQPIQQAIASRGLSNQISYVVLSMDIPFQTANGTVVNGTTSGLFYGIKTDTGAGAFTLTNSYSASELPFVEAKPVTATSDSFLATMITAGSLAQAKALVDQGANSDATYPTASVVLAKSDDPLRRIRYVNFDNAVFDTRLRGNYSVVRRTANSLAGESSLLGYQTGLMIFTAPPNLFVPGAMADSLTSYGGIIFGDTGQTSMLEFINAGAAGTYGTVSEPTATLAKFPSPQNYFYQARGFSLAECYYQSLDMPYQGLIVGEPLAAPFAVPADGGWIGVAPGDVLSGTAPLTVQFVAADPSRPLFRVDLFVDGKFSQTLTNIAPAAGNQIKVRVNAQVASYVVPANATLAGIAAGLATTLNAPAISNLTKTLALAFGDRVELRYLATNRPASPANLHIDPSGAGAIAGAEGPVFDTLIGTATAKTTFVTGARPTFLDSSAFGIRSCSVSGTVQAGTWLRLTVTKTNGVTSTVSYTNPIVGAAPANVLSNLVLAINAEPALQTADGVLAEAYTAGSFGTPSFDLLARSPGLKAAGVKVALTSSGTLVGNPATATALNANLSDLQPRNHLFFTTGASELDVTFLFNTSLFPDGYHDLTAVAYEGSNVRTQTRVSVPVRLQNTSLTAALNLLNLAAINSVSGSYQMQVTANTNSIANITLYSTGGALGAVTNQSSNTFTVFGPNLGAGTHPIYAVVQNTTGQKYRTATAMIRLENP